LTNVDAGILGRIDFQAPLDSAGTDAILVAASIWAEADDTFASGLNDTDLVFAVSESETAVERMRLAWDGTTTELNFAQVCNISSGGDITLSATGDVNIPADIGLTFGDDGEKIEGDGTNLTVASSAQLIMTPTTDTIFSNGTGVVIGHTAQVTVSDAAEFQILGTGLVDSSMLIAAFSADATGPRFEFLKSRDPAIADGTFAKALDNDLCGQILWRIDDGTDFASWIGRIYMRVDGSTGENDAPGAFVVDVTADGSAGGTERLRVDSVGNTFTNDGTISSLSDSRGKTDMSDFTDGLNVISQLNPINYKNNGTYSMLPDDGVSRIGFAADEVAKVSSHLASPHRENVYEGEGDDRRVIRTDTVCKLNQVRMIPYLVNSIKELLARIETLEAA
jgi:hypothetical protein